MMKFLLKASAIAALGALGVNAQCPKTTAVTVNSQTVSGVYEAIAGPGDSCICQSGFLYEGDASTGSCNDKNVATAGCAGADPPVASNMTTSLTGMDLKTINMTGTDTTVRFTVQVPMIKGRRYTAIGITGPNSAGVGVASGCDAASAFTTLTPLMATSGCVDLWNITVDFTKMRTCGFAVSSATNLADGYQLYDGNIRVAFMEPVDVGTGTYVAAVPRTVTVDYPVRVAFDSNYVVPMTVNDVTVYSNFQVDFAITGQNIPKDPALANVTVRRDVEATITYTVQYPYAIRGWTTSGTVVAKLADGNTNAPITATVGSGAGTNYGAGTLASICKVGNYAAADTAAASTCTKNDNKLRFGGFIDNDSANPGTCKFQGYKYTVGYAVQCANKADDSAMIAAADCPLAAESPAADNTVTFTITSENFCTGQAATDNINGVISITDFKAVMFTDVSQKQNAWRWGDKVLMRMDFAGLPLKTCKLTQLESKYQGTAFDDSETWVAGDVRATSSGPTASITTTGFSDDDTVAINTLTPQAGITIPSMSTEKLGLNTAGTRYLFYITANADFLGGSAVAPARGADSFLKLRATIDVTYDRALRRRRRQADAVAGGKGLKESEPSSIQAAEDVAAAAPGDNSAVRAAPAIALVLALLSAVALL